jgi:Fe-S cluster assembly iron-binding protein IscA
VLYVLIEYQIDRGVNGLFTVTEAAKTEILKRQKEMGDRPYARLQMRHSCYMKMKLTVEENTLPNDIEKIVDGLHFILDKEQEHYFFNKKIDYVPDKFGFMEFEAFSE